MKYLLMLIMLIVENSHAQLVLYPLQVGNRWQYLRTGPLSTDSSSFVVELIGDTTLSNRKLYVIRNAYDPRFFRQDFLRQDSERVYVALDGDTSECLLYQFDLQPGDSTCLHRFTGEHLRTIFGMPLRVFSFELYFTDGFGEDVADSIGVVNQFYDDGAYDQLTGAEINGVTYGVIAGIHNNKIDEPNDFYLSQNYPNPFNPSTSISFSMSDAGWVNLCVYDPLGQEVGLLVNELKYPGRYVVSWKPESISSGIYFYQFRSGYHIDTKAMIYLK